MAGEVSRDDGPPIAGLNGRGPLGLAGQGLGLEMHPRLSTEVE